MAMACLCLGMGARWSRNAGAVLWAPYEGAEIVWVEGQVLDVRVLKVGEIVDAEQLVEIAQALFALKIAATPAGVGVCV